MSKQPSRVTLERNAHLNELTMKALSNPDHKGCAAGHTTENHLNLCRACWLGHKWKEESWHGWIQCPRFQSLITNSLMPLDTEGLDDITIRSLKYDHKLNTESCALMACGMNRYMANLVSDWRDFDRQVKLAADDWERKHMHSLGEPLHIRRGRFGTISREVFHENQNLYTVLGVSMDGLKQRPFAKVRMSCSTTVLFVDLGDDLRNRKMSKNARRKAVRYGKPLPRDIDAVVAKACHTAVEHYLSH